jgi:hypothetical protein
MRHEATVRRLRRLLLIFFMFNGLTTSCVVLWWSSPVSRPIALIDLDMTLLRRRMPPLIAETGEERQCVENFLSNYQQICQETMHPNPANILIDSVRNALLAATGNGTVVDAWTSDEVDKWLCPCVPNDLGELTH